MNAWEEMGQGPPKLPGAAGKQVSSPSHRQELLDVQLCLMHSLPPSSTQMRVEGSLRALSLGTMTVRMITPQLIV